MGGGKKWEAEGEDVVCEKGKKNYGQKKILSEITLVTKHFWF